MSPKKDTSKPATKAAPKPIKKEPTMADDTRKQTSNMLTQPKTGQHKDEEKKAVCKLEQESLPDRRDQCAGQNGLWHQALAACDKSMHACFSAHVCLAHCSVLQVSAGCYAGGA